ncbi:MAG: prepilin-type N-terminal cleavage/methylation domain-containing protein [Candidatus Hydrogenedentes bacterium]|nr:prepilin-type N-terminal cleavage/methylation domain-containing protein [Candidatus Hydrogenedentota bacterium]
MELLLVIGIIAILAALLFPALNAATAKANESKCMSNARQWGTAATLYVADHDGAFPNQGSAPGSGFADPTPGTNVLAWYNSLPPYVGSPAASNLWIIRKMPRPRDKSIFICPAAKLEPTITSDRDYYGNYAQNQWLEAGNRPAGSGYSRYLRMSQVAKPASFVVMTEQSSGIGVNGQLGYKYGQTHVVYMGYPTSGDGFRHNSKANITFADGHAAGFAKSAIYFAGMADTDNSGGIQWNPDNSKLDYP